MLNHFLVKLANDLDKLGLFKSSDIVNNHLEVNTRLAQMPFRLDTLNRQYQPSTLNPFLNQALSPDAYTGSTYGYEVAGDVPGGIVSDIKGTNVPIALSQITPEKYNEIMRDPAKRDQFLNWFNQTLNNQYRQFGAYGADASAFERNIRKHFEAENMTDIERMNVVKGFMPQLEQMVARNVKVNPNDKQNIKNQWILRFKREPYSRFPQIQNMIFSSINKIN